SKKAAHIDPSRAFLFVKVRSRHHFIAPYDHFAVLLLTGAALGDRFGRRRIFPRAWAPASPAGQSPSSALLPRHSPIRRGEEEPHSDVPIRCRAQITGSQGPTSAPTKTRARWRSAPLVRVTSALPPKRTFVGMSAMYQFWPLNQPLCNSNQFAATRRKRRKLP